MLAFSVLNIGGMNTPKMSLAERVAFALKRIGATQQELAEACRVSPSAVSQWLDGTTKNMRNANLLVAAEFLRVSPSWLAGASEDIASPDVAHLTSVLSEMGDEERALVFDFISMIRSRRQLGPPDQKQLPHYPA